MAKPNSLTTMVRLALVKVLQPRPDPGEGWCICCSLNNGRTLVVSADGMNDHVATHCGKNKNEFIKVDITWPNRK